MDSSGDQLNRDQLNDIAERDFDFIFGLRVLGEDPPSDPRVWGEFIRGKYDQQTIRRMYIRLFISQVEGIIATMKSEALEWPSLSLGEQVSLNEASYDVADNGAVVQRPNFPKFLNNVRFAFQIYAKSQDITCDPDYGGQGWEHFREAVNIRNRLTHPKRVQDMTISDTEMSAVDAAHNWFVETYRKLLNAVIDKLKERTPTET